MEKKDFKVQVEQKLRNTSNRIKKSRKNIRLAQKEAAEFQEIHKLLESTGDESLPKITDEFSTQPEDPRLECCAIPLNSVTLNVFDEDSTFLFFNADTLTLNKFVEINEARITLEQNLIESEESFRALLKHKALDISTVGEKEYDTVGLYILYLVSVHEDPEFLQGCFEFLTAHPFRLQISDVALIFVNLGANVVDDFFALPKEKIGWKKFYFKDGNVDDRNRKKLKFPSCNLKMVGQLLLHFVTENLIPFTSETEAFIKLLVRIALDSKIRANSLSSIYSNLLSLVCFKVSCRFDANDIADWLTFEEENLPIQLEISQAILRPIVPRVQETFALKTIRNILKCEKTVVIRTPVKFGCIKSILEELKNKKLLPLEIYTILRLINYSLPGLTATKDDFVQTSGILTHLDRKISQTEDSVDLIRLKLEVAKIRHSVADLVESDDCPANDSLVASSSPFN